MDINQGCSGHPGHLSTPSKAEAGQTTIFTVPLMRACSQRNRSTRKQHLNSTSQCVTLEASQFHERQMKRWLVQRPTCLPVGAGPLPWVRCHGSVRLCVARKCLWFAKSFFIFSLPKLCESEKGKENVIFALQVKKLRFKEVKRLGHGHDSAKPWTPRLVA